MFTSKKQVLVWLVTNYKEWPQAIPRISPRGLTWVYDGVAYKAVWNNQLSEAVTMADWSKAKEPESLVTRLKELLIKPNYLMPEDSLIEETITALEALDGDRNQTR